MVNINDQGLKMEKNWLCLKELEKEWIKKDFNLKLRSYFYCR